MKIHRFYIPKDVAEKLQGVSEVEITEKDTDEYFNGEEFIHQLVHVLRFREKDIFHVFNGEVGEYKVSLISSHKKALEIKIEKEIVTNENDIKTNITLAMSLIKKDKFELVTEKATELGVKDIVPLETERVVQKHISEDRLLRITKEASEQCGRVSIPQVSDTKSLDEILKKTKDYDLCLYGNMTGDMSLKELMDLYQKDKLQNVLVCIGPEGGWTEEEVEKFKGAGFISISIHANTLRAETAAIGVLGFLSGVFLK